MTKNHSHSRSLDLPAIAHQAMLDAGFTPDLPQSALAELHGLSPNQHTPDTIRDLRGLLWSSIDDAKSRDLDQVEYAERLPSGDLRLLIGIADVDELVAQGSAIDDHAAENSTSVYTGVKTFPMLPDELSTDLTSLVGGQDRLALVIELHILDSGEVSYENVYRSRICNRGKLAYSSTGAWLEGRGPI